VFFHPLAPIPRMLIFDVAYELITWSPIELNKVSEIKSWHIR
jgi:hypothetical protein